MGELEQFQYSRPNQKWMGGYLGAEFDRNRNAKYGSYHHDFARKVSADCDHLGTSAYEHFINYGRQMVDRGCCRPFENSDSERER